MIDRKRALFGQYRQFIVGIDLIEQDDGYFLSVAALIPGTGPSNSPEVAEQSDA